MAADAAADTAADTAFEVDGRVTLPPVFHRQNRFHGRVDSTWLVLNPFALPAARKSLLSSLSLSSFGCTLSALSDGSHQSSRALGGSVLLRIGGQALSL